jgi:ACR3 family arsenite efflux pump ArsB
MTDRERKRKSDAKNAMTRVGQNWVYTPLLMTVYLKIPLPKIPYVHRVYMVLANPNCDYRESLLCTVYACFACLLHACYFTTGAVG